MHDIQVKLDVKSMSDITIEAINGFYNTETLTKQQKKWKRIY